MDWTALRDEFPVTQRWAFLDHAGVSPLPRPTVKVLHQFADDISQNGATAVGHWVDRSEAARAVIARLINGDPRGIALVKNTTEGINLVAEGYPWKPGDNVVIPHDEYPANQYPWINLASRGVNVTRVPPRGNRVEIDDLRAAMNSRTRILAVSFVGFASGFRMDMAALVGLARERGVHLLVDAIQGLGVLPFDVQKTPIDFVACGSHKWLLGPQGAGFLYVRPELLELLRPVAVGAASVVDPHNYDHIDFRLKPDATRWEGGTLNFGGFAAWAASIELLLGLEGVSQRIRYLTDQLCERGTRAGLRAFSSRNGEDWSGIVSFDLGNRDVGAVVRRCKAAGIAVNRRGGRLRACPHCYNNESDIDRLIEVAAE